MMGMQLIRLEATGALIAVVWLLVRSRRRAFLRLAVPGAQAQQWSLTWNWITYRIHAFTDRWTGRTAFLEIQVMA